MFCMNCGKQLDDSVRFCDACGSPVDAGNGMNAPSTADTLYQPQAFYTTMDPQAVSTPNGVYAQPASNPSTPPAKGSKGAIIFVLAIAIAVGIGCWVWFTQFNGGAQDNQGVGYESGTNSHPEYVVGSTKSTSSSASSSAKDSASTNASTDLSFTGVTSVFASSVLPTSGANNRGYEAINVIDGNTQHAWCENASGPGIGEWITLKGNGKQGFKGFEIWNGYQESSEIYYKNARPSQITVYVDGKKIGSYHLSDSGLTSQTIDFGKTVEGEELKIVIDNVYSGSKYEDCCISELRLY